MILYYTVHSYSAPEKIVSSGTFNTTNPLAIKDYLAVCVAAAASNEFVLTSAVKK